QAAIEMNHNYYYGAFDYLGFPIVRKLEQPPLQGFYVAVEAHMGRRGRPFEFWAGPDDALAISGTYLPQAGFVAQALYFDKRLQMIPTEVAANALPKDRPMFALSVAVMIRNHGGPSLAGSYEFCETYDRKAAVRPFLELPKFFADVFPNALPD